MRISKDLMVGASVKITIILVMMSRTKNFLLEKIFPLLSAI